MQLCPAAWRRRSATLLSTPPLSSTATRSGALPAAAHRTRCSSLIWTTPGAGAGALGGEAARGAEDERARNDRGSRRGRGEPPTATAFVAARGAGEGSGRQEVAARWSLEIEMGSGGRFFLAWFFFAGGLRVNGGGRMTKKTGGGRIDEKKTQRKLTARTIHQLLH